MRSEHPSIAGLRVVVAEDDGMVMEAICDRLTDVGCEVVARADSGADVVSAALSMRPDIILMDVRLKGDMDGISASELINEKVRVPVVYLTGDSVHETLQRAKAASAYGYVLKPFHIKNLVAAIAVAVERFRMERRLEDNQLSFATILESVADAVIAVDMERRVLFLNVAAEELTGCSAGDAQGRPLIEILALTDADESAIDLIKRALHSRFPLLLGPNATAVGRGGARMPVDGSVSCIMDSLGRIVGTSITLRNISKRRQMEASFLGAVDREQRRFASDLHDGLGQGLTGLSLLLTAVANAARATHSPHTPDLVRAADVARHALDSCRAVARGLSPIRLAEGGLVTALHDLVERLKGSSVLAVDMTVSEVSRLGLTPLATDHLYRIAQEALTNALKHSKAKSVKLSLDIEPDHVRLEVCDDGAGMSVTAGESGLGLRTMQYRASMIGARFQITPLRPQGTRVICDCPQPI